MARVVITREQLKLAFACLDYLDSPDWDHEQQALVYQDWGETVTRLLSTRRGTSYLDFLVVRKLVPMTVDEFVTARGATRK